MYDAFPTEIVAFLRDMLVPLEGTPYQKIKAGWWWSAKQNILEQVSDGGSDTEPSSPSLVAAGHWGNECFFSNKGKDEI